MKLRSGKKTDDEGQKREKMQQNGVGQKKKAQQQQSKVAQKKSPAAAKRRGKQPKTAAVKQSPKSNKNNNKNDGLSEKTAIKVGGIGEEYKYLGATYPGHKVKSQALLKTGFDVINIETKEGKKLSIYFDIKKFFPMD